MVVFPTSCAFSIHCLYFFKCSLLSYRTRRHCLRHALITVFVCHLASCGSKSVSVCFSALMQCSGYRQLFLRGQSVRFSADIMSNRNVIFSTACILLVWCLIKRRAFIDRCMCLRVWGEYDDARELAHSSKFVWTWWWSKRWRNSYRTTALTSKSNLTAWNKRTYCENKDWANNSAK
jgi:hypothetical protein